MEHLFSFHKTVQGYFHMKKQIVCQDSSISYSDKERGYHIAIVADGHGDFSCMRSEIGSKLVTEIAREELEKFALTILEEKKLREQRQGEEEPGIFPEDEKTFMRRLTDAIVFRWREGVRQHLSENPLTEEEIKKAGRYADAYRRQVHVEHIYGTTLIAALWLSDYLILIQQGDGRCDIFYIDGTVEQPIPWDERCHENITTSMCDTKAEDEIRSIVLNLKERQVAACYLGTDGVEDSYSDMEGTHVFYRNLSHQFVEVGVEEFEQYLESMLPSFSEKGSGDDVSVAGILDFEATSKLMDVFLAAMRQYRFEKLQKQYESKKISMMRKHSILQERVEVSRKELEIQQKACSQYMETVEAAKREKVQIEEKMRQMEKALASSQKEARQIEEALGAATHEELLEKVADLLQNESFILHLQKYCQVDFARKKEEKSRLFEQLREKEREIAKEEEQNKTRLQKLEEVEQRYRMRTKEFAVYDERYRKMEEEYEKIRAERDALEV